MKKDRIPFNKPFLCGQEMDFIRDAILNQEHISGNGKYSQKVSKYMEEKYEFGKCLLTTSCTDALEMSAVLMRFEPGDEVIVPSYTFVSSASAFKLHGASIVFADSYSEFPNIDPKAIRSAITEKTKAIVIVHYAGVSCDMDEIKSICEEFDLFLVEDAAQAVDCYYKGRPLGTFGDFATFSFHETKNIQCGEGGMLVVNNSDYFERAEIIWEKGTNRAAFKRGNVQKYECVDIGASYLLSDLNAAFLYAQVSSLDEILCKRRRSWAMYHEAFQEFLPKEILPCFDTASKKHNGHIYFLLMESDKKRDELLSFLAKHDICATFHYLSLEKSPFYHRDLNCEQAMRFEKSLIRLPLYAGISDLELKRVVDKVREFFHHE